MYSGLAATGATGGGPAEKPSSQLVLNAIAHANMLQERADAAARAARNAAKHAETVVQERQDMLKAQQAVLAQQKSALDAAQRQFARSEALAGSSVASERQLDIDRSNALGAEAAVASAEAMTRPSVTAKVSAV